MTSEHCIGNGRVIVGDNLQSLRALPTDSVDVVYLDPPFGTQENYEMAGASFSDKWSWDEVSKAAHEQAGGQTGDIFRAIVEQRRRDPLCAYLAFMLPRLVEIRRVVKRRGAIWLHCDDHASQYLAVLLQSIHMDQFGAPMFQTVVVWKRSSGSSSTKKGFVRVHDNLIFIGPGSRGPSDTLWDDIKPLNHQAKARVGYPTEKPVALIDRVLALSARDGERFLDPFCGSGPSLLSAHRRGLAWIGMDASEGALAAVRRRFEGEDGRQGDFLSRSAA